jgi:hypothetical protein
MISIHDLQSLYPNSTLENDLKVVNNTSTEIDNYNLISDIPFVAITIIIIMICTCFYLSYKEKHANSNYPALPR